MSDHEDIPGPWILIFFLVVLGLILCSCGFDSDGLEPIDTPPVEVQCDSNEVLVATADGGTECLPGCANGLHCWSGCCVPEPDDSPSAGHNACRPASVCFGAR